MTPELFETHAHLMDPRFDADREAVLARARAAGVARLVEIADGPAEWEKACALARERPDWVRAAAGLHPYHADALSPEVEEGLSALAARPEVVAVGEIGLDYAKSPVPAEVQRPAFERLLGLARRSGKPAILHCRDAYADLIDILERVWPGAPDAGTRFKGVVHCFSGGTAEALRCKALGFALGVDGPVTYPKNDALRAAFAEAGVECLVLETDSPWLPPQSARGKRNEPAALVEIAARLAQTLELDPARVAQATTANAKALFCWA